LDTVHVTGRVNQPEESSVDLGGALLGYRGRRLPYASEHRRQTSRTLRMAEPGVMLTEHRMGNEQDVHVLRLLPRK